MSFCNLLSVPMLLTREFQANFVVKADVFLVFRGFKKCPCQALLNHSPVFIVAFVVSVFSYLFSSIPDGWKPNLSVLLLTMELRILEILIPFSMLWVDLQKALWIQSYCGEHPANRSLWIQLLRATFYLRGELNLSSCKDWELSYILHSINFLGVVNSVACCFRLVQRMIIISTRSLTTVWRYPLMETSHDSFRLFTNLLANWMSPIFLLMIR